jgi:uncharacterized protein
MAGNEAVRVTVVYALPDRQLLVEVELPQSATVADAVARSGLSQRFPDIAARPLECAIYGRAVPLSHVLQPNDRVEILRPLQIDPKESRRQAAARGRTKPAGRQ